jgi:hypothetical protein
MQKRYHYTVRMSSWTHSKEDFDKFREWAHTPQKDFWWNYMSGPLAAFSFWAYPNEVAKVLEEQGWYAHALSIDVGKGAVPEEER